MWLSTHYFSGSLQECICGTLYSRHFSLYNLSFLSIIVSGWWIVKPKSVFFAKTLKSAPVIILIYVHLFQWCVPKWGVLANRLIKYSINKRNATGLYWSTTLQSCQCLLWVYCYWEESARQLQVRLCSEALSSSLGWITVLRYSATLVKPQYCRLFH